MDRLPLLKLPPLLRLPPHRRRVLSPLLFLVASILSFVLVGFLSNIFLLALLFSPLLGGLLSFALVGPPLSRTEVEGIVPPFLRGYLFFPIALVTLALSYALGGLLLTPYLPVNALVPIVLLLSLAASVGVAYTLVGFPPLLEHLRRAYSSIPKERRALLSLPSSVVLVLLLYLLFGLVLTHLPIPLGIVPLLSLALSCTIGPAIAFLLFGFPKPKRRIRLPPLPRPPPLSLKARRWASLGLALLLLFPLTTLGGIALSLVPTFPPSLDIPISFLLGALASVSLSLALFRLSPKDSLEPPSTRTRLILSPLAGALSAVLLFVAGGTLGAPLAFLLLPSLLLAVLVAVGVSGVAPLWWERIRRREGLLPPLPDALKPLLILPLGGLLAFLLALPALLLLPAMGTWAILGSLFLGILLSLLLVEGSTIGSILREK